MIQIPFSAKFGGATGSFNAHYVAFPRKDWVKLADEFVEGTLGLQRLQYTTQIEHYDNLAAHFDTIKRINTILIDLAPWLSSLAHSKHATTTQVEVRTWTRQSYYAETRSHYSPHLILIDSSLWKILLSHYVCDLTWQLNARIWMRSFCCTRKNSTFDLHPFLIGLCLCTMSRLHSVSDLTYQVSKQIWTRQFHTTETRSSYELYPIPNDTTP